MAIHTHRQLACMVNYYIKGLVNMGYRIDVKWEGFTKLIASTSTCCNVVRVTVDDSSDKYQMISRSETTCSPVKVHHLIAYHACNDLYADSIEEAESVRKMFHAK